MSAIVRRRVALVAGFAATLAIALPTNASGFFDHHFTVIERDTGGHEIANGFAFRFDLLNPANRDNRVGHGHARCTNRAAGKSRCRALIHLDGTIGGFGDLFARGNYGHGDHTLTVTDGNGDFSGRIAGKVAVHLHHRVTTKLLFDLTR
jgi:hypothetical protein